MVVAAARERAHLILGAIRLLNGTAALLVPSVTSRRLGSDPDASPAALYPLRLFGVRTVVLGAELLWGSEDTRRRSLDVGRLIHASDTIAAVTGGVTRQLPARTAVLLTGVSALNTVLALLASSRSRRRGRRLLRR